jgi:uncharacterized membrane protein YdjX (TVP38/TMEM64 family)
MTRRGAVLRLIALAGFVGVTILIAVMIGIPTAPQLRAHFAGLGLLAPLLFAGVYAVATLSPLPKSVFTLAAGAVFGIAEGLVVVLVGATGGAVMAFYLARALGRDGVQRLTGVRADRFDEHLARHGFATVLVARLVPVVPFTVVNYAAGLTAIRVPVFLSATALGMLPATTAYIALGAYGSEPGSWPFWVAVGALVALTVAGGVAQAVSRRRSRTAWDRPGRPLDGHRVSGTPTDDGSHSTQ